MTAKNSIRHRRELTHLGGRDSGSGGHGRGRGGRGDGRREARRAYVGDHDHGVGNTKALKRVLLAYAVLDNESPGAWVRGTEATRVIEERIDLRGDRGHGRNQKRLKQLGWLEQSRRRGPYRLSSMAREKAYKIAREDGLM